MKPHRIAAATAVLFASTLLTNPVPQPVAAQSATKKESREKKSEHYSAWVFQDDDQSLLFEIRGKVTFSEDYSAIETLSPDGKVRIRSGRGANQREVTITRDGAGGVRYDFSFGGKAHSFDDEARSWMKAFVAKMARESGFDSKRRVARLLQQGGPDAVLTEIETIKSDFAQRMYFEALLDQAKLDGGSLTKAIRLAMRRIGSDFEKRQVLSLLAEQPELDSDRLSLLIEAIASINSDFEKATLLKSVLERNAVTATQMAAAMKATRSLDSDFEKTNVLLRAVEIGGRDAVNAPDFFPAVKAIDSDFEKGRLLNRITQRLPKDTDVLIKVVGCAAEMGSDFEKANVLRRVSALRNDDPALREALRKAVETVASDFERERIRE